MKALNWFAKNKLSARMLRKIVNDGTSFVPLKTDSDMQKKG